MRRIMLLVTVALVMAAMLLATMAAAWADPPGGNGTGCESGLVNANHAIGTGSPSGERQAPYRNNPGENAGGTGPDEAFTNSEGNTSSLKCRLRTSMKWGGGS